MKMPSPLLEHRRYLKHRSRIKPRKKKASITQPKELFSKVNQQPRITEKRLTKKSGFNLNGAISTSPFLRRTKANNIKKNDIDYDLKRLLHNAKNKGSINNLGSASSCSTFSSDKGGSINLIDSPIGKGQKGKLPNNCTSFSTFPPKYKLKTREIISNSSAENDTLSGENIYDDPECIIPIVHSRDFVDQDLNFKGNSSGSTSRNVNTHHSSGHSIPQIQQIKIKKPSLSIRQKFAAGIADSLVLEIKKERNTGFISERLETVDKNLTDLYVKRHNIYKPSKFSLESNVVNDSADTTEQTELLLEKDSSLFNRQQARLLGDKKNGEEKCGAMPHSEYIAKDKHPMIFSDSAKHFKQKSIEAWVTAIQSNPLTENNNKYSSYEKKIQKTSNHQTELDFLHTITKNSAVKSNETNPFEILSKPVPLWSEGEKDLLELSPLLPPVAEHSSTAAKYSCSSDIRYQNSSTNHPSKRSRVELSSKRQDTQVQWNDNSPILIQPHKPDHSWFSWFKRSKEYKNKDQFKFNPPNLYASLKTHKKNQMERAHDLTNQADTSEVWGQFPKVAQWNVECYSTANNTKDAWNKAPENIRNKTCINSQYIKFSPRKMF